LCFIILANVGLGNILGDFFTNSSGHPGQPSLASASNKTASNPKLPRPVIKRNLYRHRKKIISRPEKNYIATEKKLYRDRKKNYIDTGKKIISTPEKKLYRDQKIWSTLAHLFRSGVGKDAEKEIGPCLNNGLHRLLELRCVQGCQIVRIFIPKIQLLFL
jgi:hypothetical protein